MTPAERLAVAEVFTAPIGDSNQQYLLRVCTAYNLRWDSGRANFDTVNDSYFPKTWVIEVFRNGNFVGETSIRGDNKSAGVVPNVSQFINDPGDYVFIVYEQEGRGKIAKSPTYTHGSGGSSSTALPIAGYKTIATNAYQTYVIKTDNTLWRWGDSGNATKDQDNIVHISGNNSHWMFIKSDGSLWGWGMNEKGQLGDGTITQRDTPVRIGADSNWAYVSAGYRHTVALKTDGSLWQWGTNWLNGDGADATILSPVKILDNVASVSAGLNYTTAIKTDGTLWIWGVYNNSLSPIQEMTGVKAVSSGYDAPFIIKSDGTLWQGVNMSTKIADNVIAVSAGQRAGATGTRGLDAYISADGSLWTWGSSVSNRFGAGNAPKKVMDGVVDVDTSSEYVVALKSDGSVWWWGDFTSNEPKQVTTGVKLPGSATTPTPPANPLDSASGWAKEGITAAIGKGFVPADIQGSYTNVITRAEFCRMAVKWLEYSLDKGIDAIIAENGDPAKIGHTFSDTTDPAILAAYRLGITGGTVAPADGKPGTFNPSGQFSREQAATMIRNTCRAAGIDISNTASAGFNDINTASDWARDSINYVRNAGIMSGTGTADNPPFNPKGN
jgi:alpha-tubulin suppressor-like RCC1 family protein